MKPAAPETTIRNKYLQSNRLLYRYHTSVQLFELQCAQPRFAASCR